MKKAILLSLLALSVLFCKAQTQHLKFMGTSMNYPLNTFVSYMQQKGFTKVQSESDVCWMEGKFAGEKVELQIYATPKTHYVHSVLVKFDENSSVSYDGMKNRLMNKYGFYFITDDDDNPEDGFVRNSIKHCKILTDCNTGINSEDSFVCNLIVLSLAKVNDYSSKKHIIILYIDIKNFLKADSEVNSDL